MVSRITGMMELNAVILDLKLTRKSDNRENAYFSEYAKWDVTLDVRCMHLNPPSLYVETVKKETDPFVLQALFRAYCFLGSGYLLCPAHHGRDLTTGSYGRAHRRLPPQIAEPWIAVAEALDVYPFLESSPMFVKNI